VELGHIARQNNFLLRMFS